MILNPTIEVKIKELALQSPEREICGLIINNDIVFPCKNESFIEHSFVLSPDSYFEASCLGEITACYHSHPTGKAILSEKDKKNADLFAIPYVIYSIQEDKFLIYTHLGYNNKYCGKPFKYGTNDCFGLAREYYLGELGININDYSRQEGWEKSHPTYFADYFYVEGFQKVADAPITLSILKPHDALLFRFTMKNHPSHVGIYLGDGKFLHHPRDKQSNIEELSSPYLRRISYVLRHRSLC